MTTLITTGGTGLVGSRLTQLLSSKYAIVDASLENQVDLLDQKLTHTFFSQNRADHVIHLAAFTDVKEAEKQRDDPEGVCYRLNVNTTKTIAQICKEQNIPLIYISTDYVFDGVKDEKYIEEDQPNPKSWYGYTKYLGEKAVIDSGCRYTILRISYPIGVHHHKKLDYLDKILNMLNTNSEVFLFDDQFVTPTFIDDLVRVIEIICSQDVNNQIYHITSSSKFTPYEIGKMLVSTLQLRVGLFKGTVQNSTAIYPHNCALANQKFVKEYGFRFMDMNEVIKLKFKELSV